MTRAVPGAGAAACGHIAPALSCSPHFHLLAKKTLENKILKYYFLNKIHQAHRNIEPAALEQLSCMSQGRGSASSCLRS